MSTALVPFDFSQLPSTQLGTDEQFAELSRGTTFLSRLQLYTKGTPIDTGKIGPGRFGIPEKDDKITDLGTQIDVVALARRPKALDMSEKEAIITNFDPTSDEFKRIAAKSAESMSGCKYGTSFLVFERKTGRFCEFFCGNKSDRDVAGEIFPFMARSQADIDALAARGVSTKDMKPKNPEPLTLKVRLAKSKKGFSWHVPEVQPCSLPFDNAPSLDRIVEEINRFKKTEGDGVEKVAEDNRKSRAR